MFWAVEGQCVLGHICRAGLFVGLGLGFGTTLAIAEDQLVTKSATNPAPGDYSAWIKVCAKNDLNRQVCMVKHEALDPKTGNVLLTVAMRATEGEDKLDLLVNVPTVYSLVIPAGVRIKVDKHEPVSLQYTVCLPTSCQAQTELTKQVLDGMRKGDSMLVAAINVQQKAITFQVPLNGFSKTSDGASVDPAKYQETRRRMMEMAKQAAEDQQKHQRLIGQQANPSQPVGSSMPTTDPAKRTPAQSSE